MSLPTRFTEANMRKLASEYDSILHRGVVLSKVGTKWFVKIMYVVTPSIALTTREMIIYLQGLLDGVGYNAWQDGYDSAMMDFNTPNK